MRLPHHEHQSVWHLCESARTREFSSLLPAHTYIDFACVPERQRRCCCCCPKGVCRSAPVGAAGLGDEAEKDPDDNLDIMGEKEGPSASNRELENLEIENDSQTREETCGSSRDGSAAPLVFASDGPLFLSVPRFSARLATSSQLKPSEKGIGDIWPDDHVVARERVQVWAVLERQRAVHAR